MKPVNCPYTKISETEANDISLYSATSTTTVSDKNNFSLISRAEAQGVGSSPNISLFAENLSSQLTLPFLFLVFSFFLFIFLMSFVYLYHWKKYGMGDRLLTSFIPIYFGTLILLSLPLIYNLYF